MSGSICAPTRDSVLAEPGRERVDLHLPRVQAGEALERGEETSQRFRYVLVARPVGAATDGRLKVAPPAHRPRGTSRCAIQRPRSVKAQIDAPPGGFVPFG